MPRLGAEEQAASRNSPAVWRFELDFHPAQREIFEHPARFKVVAAGRRFGKTLLAMAMLLVVATSKPDALCLWVAPSHDTARKAMRAMLKLIPRRYREVNRTTQEIYLSTGGIIMFRSAERFDNLRGDGLDFVVCDEAAFIPKEAWTQAIRPALSDKKGKALLISTFDGENWFYDLYRQAIATDNKSWEGWRFPTSANPYIDPEEIEEFKRNNPREVYLQEFEASPMAFAGAVFPGERLDAAWEAGVVLEEEGIDLLGLQPDGRPVLLRPEAGLDWGHLVTAFEVCVERTDGTVVWMYEQVFEKVELTERCYAIADLCKRLGVETLYSDAAGASENVTLAKVLEEVSAPTFLQPVPFNAYKRPGVITRGWYLERGREVIMPACRQLLVDSKAYHYDRTGEKPAKGHDHTVDAATCFYASRANEIGDILSDEEAAA